MPLTGDGTAHATRKKSSTPFAPVATLRPIAVDSETHSATTNNSPAAAYVSSETSVPSATNAAPSAVATTYARACLRRSPLKSASVSSPITLSVANTARTSSPIAIHPR